MAPESERIPVVPEVLKWARTSAGLSLPEAAKKLGVAVSSLEKWESGELQPTIKQLRNAGKQYRRPLAVLLLPRPPKDFSPLNDFRRRVSGRSVPWSPALHNEFKRAISQREVLLELREIAPGTVPERQLKTVDMSVSPEAIGARIREDLQLDTIRAGIWSKPHDILNEVIGRVEDLGVLVLHTQRVPTYEMAAFSISNRPFPVIALNGADWPRPRLFSLFHEVAHIVINAGGLCDLHESGGDEKELSSDLEHFCNAVAAAVLMPNDRFLREPMVSKATRETDWSLEELQTLSRTYGASSEAVLLRLVGLNRASWDLYWRLRVELSEAYEEALRREKDRQKESEGGPSYYVVKARDLGRGYVASVLDAFHSRAISSLDAADYLNVRYEQIPKLEKAALG